jgi:hypothetical protein
MNAAPTFPACLIRTLSQDREDAISMAAIGLAEQETIAANPGRPQRERMQARVEAQSIRAKTILSEEFHSALASVYHREALAIDAEYRGLPDSDLKDAARGVLNALFFSKPSRYSLEQRAILLRSARAVVKLALEMKGYA